MALLGTGFGFNGFTASGYVFSPSGSPLCHWDAGDLSGSYADGDPVDSWAEKIASQAMTSSGGNRPTFETGELNGYPGVKGVSGSGHQMNLATFSGGALSQPNTIFIVARVDALESGDRYLWSAGSGSNNYLRVGQAETPNYEIEVASGALLGTSTAMDTNAHYYTILLNGGSSTVRQDGVEIASGNAGANTWTGLEIFSIFSGTDYLSATIFEIIIYDGNESAGTNEGHLATKYGL